MNYNDIFRRFRYAVNMSDATIIEIFALTNTKVDAQQLGGYFKHENDRGYQEMPAAVLDKFLDGLIIYTRGRRDDTPVTAIVTLNNNMVLKKIRIALQLCEQDMLDIFSEANFKISKAELSALFRKQGHKNYKACGDQIVRNFLQGLTIHNRS
ncbi:MAG: DUF1456 family protein [Desulfuromonas sp.]|nr:DUF1456 family protein [Desulfuromonas sp.]